MAAITWKMNETETAVIIERANDPKTYEIDLATYAAAAEQTILISDTTGISVNAPCFDALQAFVDEASEQYQVVERVQQHAVKMRAASLDYIADAKEQIAKEATKRGRFADAADIVEQAKRLAVLQGRYRAYVQIENAASAALRNGGGVWGNVLSDYKANVRDDLRDWEEMEAGAFLAEQIDATVATLREILELTK